MHLKRILILALLPLMVFIACEDDKPDPSEILGPRPKVVVTPTKKYNVPAFNGDSAYAFVAKQVSFGPRVPGTPTHQECKDWLVSKFEGYGLDVIEQDFTANFYTGVSAPATNIIAQHNPTAKKRIILAAHWDTRSVADSPLSTERQTEPIMGADDGGSGVGVLLEIARLLQSNPIDERDLGVDIILFDAEDNGQSGGSETTWCLGSQYWAAIPHIKDYYANYGILLDMVGSQSPRFTKDQVSRQYAGPFMNKVWALAQSMGAGDLFLDIPSGPMIDDHYFVNTMTRDIRMIDIINKPAGSQTGFGEYWHTHNDDMDIISKESLRKVGQVISAVVFREASGTF